MMLLTLARREWVAKCLGQMTEGNRAEAQAELKQVIADSFAAKTLWTTDWAGVQLQRCALSSIVSGGGSRLRNRSRVYYPNLLPLCFPQIMGRESCESMFHLSLCLLEVHAIRPRDSNDATPASNKKTKKNSASKSSGASALDLNDVAALNRRAARFQREHDIERQKSYRQLNNHSSSSSYGTHANHLFKSRSGTPATYDADEPEANTVCVLRALVFCREC